MKKYKVGIIGCGRIAGYLEDDPLREHPCTHIGAYKAVGNVDVVACCSNDPENAEQFSKRFDIPRVYTDYKEMLATEQLDIVSIATYAPSHAEITIACAAHHVKAIFCEKAMATSLKEADAMIMACQRHHTVLVVNHTRRWGSDYYEAKKMIEDGSIGRLQSITGAFSGNLVHTGVHLFDMMIYLAGDPLTVCGTLCEAVIASKENDSGYKYCPDFKCNDKDGYGMIEFKNGVVGHFNGLSKKYFLFELDIQGTEGRIQIGNGLFAVWGRAKSKRCSDFFDLKAKRVPQSKLKDAALVWAIKDIIAAIPKGSGTRCDGTEARKAFEVALAVHESNLNGGTKIVLPLKNKNINVVSR